MATARNHHVDRDSTPVVGPAAYLVVLVITLLGIHLEVLPSNLVTGFGVTMVLGWGLAWIGNSLPGIRTFGGAPILCILVPASLVHADLFPASAVEIVSAFFYMFIDLFIAGIIVGSVLSMNREVLLKVGVRLAVPVLGAVAVTFALGGTIGHLTGFGFGEAILFVVAPVMGGGIGAGAIPMSEIYAAQTGGVPADYMSRLVPAIFVANIVCVVLAGILNGLGRGRFASLTGFSGNGDILRVDRVAVSDVGGFQLEAPSSADFSSMAVGIIIASAFYIVGHLVALIIPGVHAYAWMILATGVVRVCDWAPAPIVRAAGAWYGFVAKTWVPAILVAVSITLIQMDQLIAIMADPAYLGITVVTVLCASLSAGFLGVLASMYFLEAAIVGGLCMADVGGSGDVAVLGASERMHLIPFAQMSSRLGGALMLVIMSFLAPTLT